jgi:hypothetical protein
MTGVRFGEDGISSYLDQMLGKAQTVRGWLNRVAYPLVIKAQRLRWETEGASEGVSWAPLNPDYARWKLRKYADAPGGGRHILIATARLVQGMTGDNIADHYKLVEDTRLTVGTTLYYAQYVDEKRDITTMSDETISEIKADLANYLTESFG